MAAEGVKFVTGVQVGPESEVSLSSLKSSNDAVVISTGAQVPRDLKIKNRELEGIHFAMEFLHANKHVIVIGGGDTGNDCIGTSVRHGAKSVTNFELLPQPPPERARDNPWPQWPRIYRVDYGHTEVKQHYGQDPREFCVMSQDFVGEDGKVTGVNINRVEWTKSSSGGWDMKPVEGSNQFFPADLVLLSMGFLGPDDRLFESEVELDPRKNIKTPKGEYNTNIEGVFAAGDCRRGQSLIVSATVLLLSEITNMMIGLGHQRRKNVRSTSRLVPHGHRLLPSRHWRYCSSISARFCAQAEDQQAYGQWRYGACD
jgi:glutamate synthase (NADH)